VANNKMVSDTGDQPFTLKTPFRLTADTNSRPAYGKIIKQNGTPLENVGVLLKINKAYPLFTFTKLSGEWLIPLQYIVDTETNQERKLSTDEKVTLEAEQFSKIKKQDEITKEINELKKVEHEIYTLLGIDMTE
jgi:hypothetical protein